MLALDQNSSVIEMAATALAERGLLRQPTYDEIVDAKLDIMRNLAPAASGVLIDAYYGTGRRSPRRPFRPARDCWFATRCRAARRTTSAHPWRLSSPAGACGRSSSWGPTP